MASRRCPTTWRPSTRPAATTAVRPDGTEPGYYWLNTYALETRPLYNLEALTLHEAVPGHHLQIALANEASDVPKFRRYSYISAFGEGWGLYSEWLGLEAGFYTDPYSNFGRLTYAMWRACAAGRRHGHAREGLDPPAVDRLPRGQHRAVVARVHDRDRSLHQLARPGALVQDRASSRSGNFAPAPSRHSVRSSTAVVSTTRCSPTDQCRCPCWSSRSTRSSRGNRRADARLPGGRRHRLPAFVLPGRLARPSTTPDSRIRDPRDPRIRVTRSASRPARLRAAGESDLAPRKSAGAARTACTASTSCDPSPARPGTPPDDPPRRRRR